MQNLLLFFLVGITFNVNAQTVVYKKIGQRHDTYLPSSSSWKNVDSFRWAYNTNALVTELTALATDNANNWNNQYRYSYTFDNENHVKTQIRENGNGTNWVNNTKYTNEYDVNGDMTVSYYDTWNGSGWNPHGKLEYTGYNSKHNWNTELLSLWTGSNWEFLQKNIHQFYSNDTQGQFQESYYWNSSSNNWDPLERFYFTWNLDKLESKTRTIPFNGSWFNESKEIHTYSTIPFLLMEDRYQVWDTTVTPATWLNKRRTSYTYNTSNYLESTLDGKYDKNTGFWVDEGRRHYLYNTDTFVKETYDEVYINAWVNNTRNTYTYTDSNITEEIQYTGLGSGWLEQKKLSYLYDMNKLNTFRQIDTFNGAVFIPNNRDFYYYNTFTVNTKDIHSLLNECVLYPNPANDYVNIKLNAKESMNIVCKVMDLLGRTRITAAQPVFVGANQIQIPITSLSEGYYLLRLQTINSTKYTILPFQVVPN